MNIILTGSGGFVGKNLRQYLTGFEISHLSLRYLLGQNIGLQNADAIVHLSGKAHDLKKVSHPSDYYEANLELTKQLYNAFLKSDAKKFIFISSVKAAADCVEQLLIEDIIPNPQTHYGKSKLMAEEYIKLQPLPEGKYYYILRPCMIHGSGNKGNLNLLYQFVSRGLPYPLASYKNRRSFLSIENLCFVIKELLEQDIPSGIYNVADDAALSTNELVTLISKALQKPPRLWKVPASLINSIAKIGDKLNLPLNTERLGKLTENYVVDNSRIKQVLKKELPVSAREGLLKTFRSFSNNHTVN